ncbi:hypothetical protein BGZ89_003598 [Linnemannia elongata]|nr:hypothetical protein BGZ89_003598 [Linnemannia elongata]
MSPSMSESDEPQEYPSWARMTPIHPTTAPTVDMDHQQQQHHVQQQQYHQYNQSQQYAQEYLGPISSKGHPTSETLHTPPYSPPMSPRYGSASATRYSVAPYPQFKAHNSGYPSSMMESSYHPHRQPGHQYPSTSSAGPYGYNHHAQGSHERIPLPLPSISGNSNHGHNSNHGSSSNSNNGSDFKLPPISSLLPSF